LHEYALVEALLRRVEAEATARGATAVHGLRVSLGELSGVEPDLFRTAYETFRAGTACAGAGLALEIVPARWSCPRCGAAIPAGAVLRCAPCGTPARLSAGGDALLLESIDMEVP
jgi:hydrogenase nickel incorporation protein HypA/HybF